MTNVNGRINEGPDSAIYSRQGTMDPGYSYHEAPSQPYQRIPFPSKPDGDAAGTVVNNITNNNIVNGDVIKGGGIATDGLGWFHTNWQTIAIVGGTAVVIAALAKLIKKLDNGIKNRYNKCVKTLLKMQKAFTLDADGLKMDAVLPGLGSKIKDKISNFFHGTKEAKNAAAIGLTPFCERYKNEITRDFEAAQKAWNAIPAAARGADDETHAENSSAATGSTKVYSSFREAIASDYITEGEHVDESFLAAASAALSLGAITARAGKFIFNKMKDGQPVPEEAKEVAVTKESTREVCYAILNNFGDKYINMKTVFKKIGVNGEDLADLDKSSCDKLADVLKKYGDSPSKSSVNVQYGRIKKAYDNMLSHYYKIGDGIIGNFVRFTNDGNKDEKHADLLLASQEKLRAMWDGQKEIYDNNFSRIVIEIMSCPAYKQYLDFITEQVIPVFKSGIAGDADYVLDVMPKAGEYYVVRQTLTSLGHEADAEGAEGNAALAKIISFNRDKAEIEFELMGRIKSEIEYTDDGTAVIKDASDKGIDFSAYKSKGEDNEERNDTHKLPFGKWLSLDPALTEYEEKKEDEGKEKSEDRAIFKKTREDRDVIYVYKTKDGVYQSFTVDGSIERENLFELDFDLSDDTFKEILAGIEGYAEVEDDDEKAAVDKLRFNGESNKSTIAEEKDLAPAILGGEDEPETEERSETKRSGVYHRENGDVVELVYASADEGSEKLNIVSYSKYVNGNGATISVDIKEEFDDDVFDKMLTSEYVEGHENDAKYKTGFKKYDEDSDKDKVEAALNLKAAASETVDTLADFVVKMNATVADAKQIENTTVSEDVLAELKSCADPIFASVARNQSPEGEPWKWGYTKNIEDSSSTKKIEASIKQDANGFDIKFLTIGAKLADGKEGNLVISFTDSTDYKDIPVETKADDVKEKMALVFEAVPESKIEFGSWTVDAIGDALEKCAKACAERGHVAFGLAKTEAINSSVKTSYAFNAPMTESTFGNKVSVERRMTGNLKGYYIVSESYVYDANVVDPKAVLADSAKALLESVRTKDDIMSYAKAHKNVKVVEFAPSVRYDVRCASAPTKYAPMYESVVAIKTDKYGKITDTINFGVNVTF